MARQTTKKQEEKQVVPAASSLEAQENRCIALALNIAEQQLRDGTASAQVISHFLREGSTKQQLEKENLGKDIELKGAKTEAIKMGQRVEELYADAIKAMKKYRGELPVEQDDQMLP